MKIKSSAVHVALDQKDGKTFANALITLVTDTGSMREIEIEIPSPVEDWEKVDVYKGVVEKFKGEKHLVNTPVDDSVEKFSDS